MTGYTYQPLEDSFFGILIGELLQEEGISKEDILKSIYSNFKNPKSVVFVGTPKLEKQIVMNILPDKFRLWISEKNFQNIKEEFKKISCSEKPQMDIALELLEWIFTGFEEDALVLDLIQIFIGIKIKINIDFIQKLKLRYEKSILEAK